MKGLPWHRPERLAHRIALGIGLALFGSAALWLTGLPFVSLLPAWFYLPLGPRVLEPSAWVLVGLAVPLLGWLAARSERMALVLLCLVLTSVAAQVAVLAMDRSTLSYRLEQGHGEFFRIAHERRGAYLETMRDYESLSASGALGAFAPSKPPGTLSFYCLIDALGDLRPIADLTSPFIAEFRSRPTLEGREAGAAAGAIFLPLFTALAVIPIFFAARRLGGTRHDGVAAALVFALSPGILLINYHADGALFPLLATSVVALALVAQRSVKRSRWLWLGLAGVTLAVGIWCNFSTLPLVGFLGIFFLMLRAEAGARPQEALIGASLDLLVLVFAAVAVLAILSLSGLFAHPFERFTAALEHHRRWKNDAIGGVFGAIGALEYWLWAGLPLLFVCFVATGGALRRLVRWAPEQGDASVLAALAVHLVMAVFTGCVEAARLWLWVTPLFALAAARFLRARAATGAPEELWVGLVVSQGVLTLLMRFCQPW